MARHKTKSYTWLVPNLDAFWRLPSNDPAQLEKQRAIVDKAIEHNIRSLHMTVNYLAHWIDVKRQIQDRKNAPSPPGSVTKKSAAASSADTASDGSASRNPIG